MSSSTPNRSHVLLTLGILFTIGGVTRFLPSTLAVAEEADLTAGTNATDDQNAPEAPVTKAVSQGGDPEQVCFSSESAELLAQDRWMFESERSALEDAKLALDAKRAEISEQVAQLEALQTTLEARWQEMQTVSDKDLQHLARMYAAMKPAQAATIFDNMDSAFAAGFLRLIDSEQAGLILASMDPGRAYVVSLELASKHSDIRASTEAP